MMIKNIFNTTLWVLAGTLLFSSCSKELDLEPRQSINADEALDSYDKLENALTGAYDGIQSGNSYGQAIIQLNELLADNIHWQGSLTSYTEVAEKLINTSNDEASGLWIQSYDIINRSNRVIDKINENSLSGGTYDANKDRMKGEALFLRGITYFELTRFFSQPLNDGETGENTEAVPLILHGVSTVEQAKHFPQRDNAKACYEQVITDLTAAAELLPATNGDRATTWAAKAILSRVYMALNNYEMAGKMADDVIKSAQYDLMPNVMTFITTKNSQESIFEVQMRTSDNLGGQNASLADYWSPAERGEISIPEAVVNRYTTNDNRRAWFREVDGQWYTNKYTDVAANVPVVRYAEILLNRAEALAMTTAGVDDEAVNMVNKVRERAGIDNIDPQDHDELVLAIKNERVMELVHEGHLFNDYKRWKKTDIGFSSGNGTLPWNDPRFVFPIPQRERDVNANLSQNTGY